MNTDRTTTKVIVEDEPARVETVVAHLRSLFTITHESKDQHVKLTTHVRRTLRLLLPNLARPAQRDHVVLNQRDLRVLLKAASGALGGDEEQYLFIYPKSPRIPFALVSKPAYDAMVAQGSQQQPPSPSGTTAGRAERGAGGEGETEPPMP